MSDYYGAVNQAMWDERAPVHAASPDYRLDRFAADPAFRQAGRPLIDASWVQRPQILQDYAAGLAFAVHVTGLGL